MLTSTSNIFAAALLRRFSNMDVSITS